MCLRAKQAGAKLADWLVVGEVTHVIANKDFNADEAAKLLEHLPQQTDSHKVV